MYHAMIIYGLKCYDVQNNNFWNKDKIQDIIKVTMVRIYDNFIHVGDF